MVTRFIQSKYIFFSKLFIYFFLFLFDLFFFLFLFLVIFFVTDFYCVGGLGRGMGGGGLGGMEEIQWVKQYVVLKSCNH